MNRSLLQSIVRRATAPAEDCASDGDLLRRFAAGRDDAAFAAIVRRHGPLVWAVCRSLLPVEQDAEDAFQATFLALIKVAGTAHAPTSVGGWLHGAAYRVSLKARRTAGRRRPKEQAAARSEAASQVAESSWDRLRVIVHEEVSLLPEKLRTAFVLCELEGVGQREAAKALGWKIGTLSGRLTKARQRLLDRLDRRGVSAGLAVAVAVTGGSATASVPLDWVAKITQLARSNGDLSGVVSRTVLDLARGATEVSMTRTKLMAAAVVLAIVAGSATVYMPQLGAQTGPGNGRFGNLPAQDASSSKPDDMRATAAPPVASPESSSPVAQWEYEFVPRDGESFEQFRKMLADHGAVGWEYCGTESFAGSGMTAIFKRPKSSNRAGNRYAGAFGQKYGDRSQSSSSSSDGSSSSQSANRYSGTIKPLPVRPETGDSEAPKKSLGMAPTKNAKAKDATVIHLSNSLSDEVAAVLIDLLGNKDCTVLSDPRSNSIVLQGDDATIKQIQRAISLLDRGPGQGTGKPGK